VGQPTREPTSAAKPPATALEPERVALDGRVERIQGTILTVVDKKGERTPVAITAATVLRIGTRYVTPEQLKQQLGGGPGLVGRHVIIGGVRHPRGIEARALTVLPAP
jgi:hypothetical protein